MEESDKSDCENSTDKDVTIDIRDTNKKLNRGITFSDISNDKSIGEISKEEVKFLKYIMKKASIAQNEHVKIAGQYKRYNAILSTIGRVLSTLAGSAGIGSLLSLKPSDPGFVILLVISLISLCAGTMDTLRDTLKYEKKATVRKKLANNFSSIVTNIAQFLSKTGSDRKDIEIFTNSITLEINVQVDLESDDES